MAVPFLYEPTWERMIRAVEKVRERCDRTAKALEAAGIPYAVIGGNAVANWVARVDEEAVRNTRDVDILIRREDLEAAKSAMDAAGFDYAQVAGVDLFVERPDGKPSEWRPPPVCRGKGQAVPIQFPPRVLTRPNAWKRSACCRSKPLSG